MIRVPKKCEVLKDNNYEFCGAPAETAYPALAGGWMPLCRAHGAKHSNITLPISVIEAGGRHEMWNRNPDARRSPSPDQK